MQIEIQIEIQKEIYLEIEIKIQIEIQIEIQILNNQGGRNWRKATFSERKDPIVKKYNFVTKLCKYKLSERAEGFCSPKASQPLTPGNKTLQSGRRSHI